MRAGSPGTRGSEQVEGARFLRTRYSKQYSIAVFSKRRRGEATAGSVGLNKNEQIFLSRPAISSQSSFFFPSHGVVGGLACLSGGLCRGLFRRTRGGGTKTGRQRVEPEAASRQGRQRWHRFPRHHGPLSGTACTTRRPISLFVIFFFLRVSGFSFFRYCCVRIRSVCATMPRLCRVFLRKATVPPPDPQRTPSPPLLS